MGGSRYGATVGMAPIASRPVWIWSPAQDRHRPIEEHPAGVREDRASAEPAEQGLAQPPLQLQDLLAQRGLRHVAPLRRPAEVARLGHGHEVPKLMQLHRQHLSNG
jgi:hypothetical protein